MAFDNSRFLVYCHAGEVAHMLIGARQLVEERSFSAVLIAQKRKGQFLIDDVFMLTRVTFQRVHFTITGVSFFMAVADTEVMLALLWFGVFLQLYVDFLSICQSER